MRRRHAALTALVAALVTATGASASVRIKGVDAASYPSVRLSVIASGPLSKAPTLVENGQPVVGLRAQNLGREKYLVLAIDKSHSMEGTKMRDAIAAARAFVAAKPQSDRIAVAVFGRSADMATRFTASTIDADTALRTLGVDAQQGTALYDAVALASRSLGAQSLPGRVLVLLTDGRDQGSKTSLDAAIAAAKQAGVAVYPIAILGGDATPEQLVRLARETGGTYYPAPSTEALGGIYRSIAAELSRTWRLEYVTSARPGDQLRLQTSVPKLGAATASVTVPGDAGSSASGGGSKLLPTHFYTSSAGTLMLALAVGFLVLVGGGLALAARQGAWLKGRLDPHVVPAAEQRRASSGGGRERLAMFKGLFKATESAFGHLRQWQSVQRLLERADLPLRTVEFFWMVVGAAFAFGLLAAVMGAPVIFILLAFAVGGSLPFGFIWFKANRRLNAFENQLPDLLITLAASLKAGHSFRQGIQTVVDEGQAPASDEFKRVLAETRLGRPMDDALGEMSDRVGSRNLEFVITAVTIQRQVGGSLAGLFDMVAEAVRNRQQFARKIKSLTAMGRMSAYVLIGLPFFMAGMLTLVNPTYMAPLYSTSVGHKLIIVGLVMMGFGSLILKKIVSFKG
jgi:tight adherence protein B